MDRGKRFSGKVEPGQDPGPVIQAVIAGAEEFAEIADLAESDRRRLLVVVEELVANVVRHGVGSSGASFVLALDPVAEGVSLTLSDSGIAFDPTEPREFSGPDRVTGGGVGLALVREWSRGLAYRREAGRNHLALVLPCERKRRPSP